MAKKKEGELRLLKDGVVFGPTDRAGLDRLLAAGRVTPQDQVSVRNGDWVLIADFLGKPAPPPEPPAVTEPSAPLAAGPKKAGDLRVINGGRVIDSLTRMDVRQLMTDGRLGEDDLVCALDGPWMRLGDFLSTRTRPQPTRQRWSEDADMAPSQGASPGRPVRSADSSGSQPMVVMADHVEVVQNSPGAHPAGPVDPPADSNANQPVVVMADHVEIMQSKGHLPLVEPMAVIGKSVMSPDPAVTYQLTSAPREKGRGDDQWYVRIRAMCSAPLGKRHLKQLYQSREITAETLARHPKWHENDWRPISAIPELAELSRP